MSTTNRVYPSRSTMDTYPLFSHLDEKGIKQNVRWSVTNFGPQFVFDFSELGKQNLAEITIPSSQPQTKVGTFAKEGALGTTHYSISMDKVGEIWMCLQEPIEHISPIFLASSPLKLAEIVDRFAVHLECIKKSNQEIEWEADWRRFLNDCRKIDPKGGSSYWASLAVDYLEHE